MTGVVAVNCPLKCVPKQGELPNGKAAWDGLAVGLKKYQYRRAKDTAPLSKIRQPRRLYWMARTHTSIFINELYNLRDELLRMMGEEEYHDDGLLGIVSEGLSGMR